jgi:hypothetical protein
MELECGLSYPDPRTTADRAYQLPLGVGETRHVLGAKASPKSPTQT